VVQFDGRQLVLTTRLAADAPEQPDMMPDRLGFMVRRQRSHHASISGTGIGAERATAQVDSEARREKPA